MIINNKQNKKGFTLIEGLVALAVFLILVVTFYKVFTETMMHMQDSKYRRGAVALANERMEHFRNLAYENVATKANAPIGDIEDDENVLVNGLNYRVITSVFFVDDPADGLASGGDVRFEDYKRIHVTILWDKALNFAEVSKSDAIHSDAYKSKRINLVSQFVPPGGLEAMPTGGILSINVLDTSAEPVEPIAGAIVSIVDDACDTAGHPDCTEIMAPLTTDSTGNIMYIGAPICADCYEITVETSGYEKRETLEPFSGDDGNPPLIEGEFNPTYIHQGIAAGNITTVTFNTNKISQFNIKSQDPFDNEIPGVTFDLVGGMELGTRSDDGSIVYNYNETALVTDATDADIDIESELTDSISGNGNYANAGLYVISNIVLPSGYEDYEFWKIDPNDKVEIFNGEVNADTNVEAEMLFGDTKYDSAGIRVVEMVDDGSGGQVAIPINESTVQVQSTTLTPQYDVTLTTSDFGYAYFPENELDALVNSEVYDITVNAVGYNEATTQITVDELILIDVEITAI